MEVEVAAPHVDDERHRRLERGDVREVLFWTDADVRASGHRDPREFRNDLLKLLLVRDQVAGPTGSARLGQIVDELPEFLIGELRRQGAGGCLQMPREL